MSHVTGRHGQLKRHFRIFFGFCPKKILVLLSHALILEYGWLTWPDWKAFVDFFLFAKISGAFVPCRCLCTMPVPLRQLLAYVGFFSFVEKFPVPLCHTGLCDICGHISDFFVCKKSDAFVPCQALIALQGSPQGRICFHWVISPQFSSR